MNRDEIRAKAVEEARAWLGTPYRHMASEKNAGADCLGLVLGVWRAVMDKPEPVTPEYRPDWAERGEEVLLEGMRRHMVEIPLMEAKEGDLLLFRMAPLAAIKHVAVLSSRVYPEARIIHAYWGRAVVESWMGQWWRNRLVAAFTWPVA